MSNARIVCIDQNATLYQSESIKSIKNNNLVCRMFETLPQAVEVPGLQSCRSVKDLWQSCSCTYSMRLEWYPCMLKYCRNKDSLGHGASYKCGIKSCSKGYDFTYYTPHKQLCLWEEET
ncbi:out at first protein-like [Silurus asotus]|uniref:Out at first protein-like n=1 Tax=Silurus asotus TaxID=30991 RepID=A0AAD5FKS9_SILAS|nr:out at first protein-like [Silurus asotus]